MNRELHTWDPADLDKHLSKFFVVVRVKDDSEYKPFYLPGIMGFVERYFERHKYSTSIIRDIAFSVTTAALICKQKHLKKKGKGNRPIAANFITDTDIDRVYARGQLGAHCLPFLLNTLLFNNTLHFGMRRETEGYRALCYGDLKLGYDSQ